MATATVPQSTSELGLIRPLFESRDGPEGGTGASGSDETWERLVDELRRLQDLQDDWDGQGASAPEAENLKSARSWIERMRCWPNAIPPTKVVPGVTGEVVLVWQEPGLYLEAEITGANEVEWLWTAANQQTRQWKTDLDAGWLVGVVA